MTEPDQASPAGWTADEIMTVEASRSLRGGSVCQVKAATGWDLTVSDNLRVTSEPTEWEIATLRQLEATKGHHP